MWLAHGLTLSRIPIAVVFWLTYGDRWLSLSLVVLAALTDALDGNVARWVKRRTGNTSTLGEWLDPVADKLFIILVLGAIQVHDPVPWLLLAMICARELVLIPLAMIYRLVVAGPGGPRRSGRLHLRRGQHAFQAQGLGKAATIAELAAIVAIILRSPAVMPIAVAAAVLGLAAVAVYISRAAHRHEKVAA